MRVSAALAVLSAYACARIEPPPGGPPDDAPPRLVAVVPESLVSLPRFDQAVEFRFDEVISETPAGGSFGGGGGEGESGLERLVIVSPTTRAAEVDWRRNRITVRPEEGWRRDRVYRVELLPGVTDLRGNRSREGAVVTFTTGAARPEAALSGLVVDWGTRRPAAGALVVALLLPDSLPYRAVADSSGRFRLGPVPGGDYVVSGVVDANGNRRQDSREAYDTARVGPGRGEVPELWAFVHDTSPPRIRTVTVQDSVSAAVEFSQPLDPRQRLDARAVSLRRLPDSTPVAVGSLLTPQADDSLRPAPPAAPRGGRPAADTGRAARARGDTIRGADTARKRDTVRQLDTPRLPDTARARPREGGEPPAGARDVFPGRAGERRPGTELPEITTRPPLSDRLVLRVTEPWRPGARYALELRGVRNVTGVRGDVRTTVVVPEARRRDRGEPPTPGAAPDTTPDTARARAAPRGAR